MSIETAKAYLAQFGKDQDVIEFTTSSATVELAAQALGTQPAKIAKSITFKVAEGCVMVVTAGDTKIDNAKYKAMFGTKAKMLTPEEVFFYTGHNIGGVCPFGITNPDVQVYTDVSLQRFDAVYPACGSSNSCIRLTCEELFDLSGAKAWIDVCKFTE